jgi:hypothetical protein
VTIWLDGLHKEGQSQSARYTALEMLWRMETENVQRKVAWVRVLGEQSVLATILIPNLRRCLSHGPPVSATTFLTSCRVNCENMKVSLENYLVLSRPFGKFAKGLESLWYAPANSDHVAHSRK